MNGSRAVRRLLLTRELDEVSKPRLAVILRRYDLGYSDDEACRLEPIVNPFTPKVLPMSSE